MLNWDFATFSCGNESFSGELVYVPVNIELVSRVRATELEKQPVTVLSTGELGIYIKKVHLHNALGQIAPPIYVIQDTTLADDAFEVHKVPGLTHSSDAEAFGYIVFGKSRCLNLQFYEWFFLNYVFPFVETCQSVANAKVCSYDITQNIRNKSDHIHNRIRMALKCVHGYMVTEKPLWAKRLS